MFILFLRDMESFVIPAESKIIGKKKRKLQNEEYHESSSSVQVNEYIFIKLSLNEHCTML